MIEPLVDPQEFYEVWELVKDIYGGCDKREAEFWWESLTWYLPSEQDCRGKYIVELGSLDGAGTLVLAYAARLIGARVISVDLHATDPPPDTHEHRGWYDERRQNLIGLNTCVSHIVQADLKPWVQFVVDDTIEAAKTVLVGGEPSVIFLHVDAFHDYPRPREDFLAWSQKIAWGGMVLFHDCTDPGVDRCVRELVEDGGLGGYAELELPPLEEMSASSWSVGWRTRGFRRVLR